jgi:hypothetical protein
MSPVLMVLCFSWAIVSVSICREISNSHGNIAFNRYIPVLIQFIYLDFLNCRQGFYYGLKEKTWNFMQDNFSDGPEERV